MICFRAQESLNERIELTIHHRLYISCFRIRTMILDHRIRLENIRTYLAAPFDLLLIAFKLRQLGFLLFQLQFKEFGTQHLQTLLTILQLRTLILALHDNTGRFMCHTHRGRSLIDMLPASTACEAISDARSGQ